MTTEKYYYKITVNGQAVKESFENLETPSLATLHQRTAQAIIGALNRTRIIEFEIEVGSDLNGCFGKASFVFKVSCEPNQFVAAADQLAEGAIGVLDTAVREYEMSFGQLLLHILGGRPGRKIPTSAFYASVN